MSTSEPLIETPEHLDCMIIRGSKLQRQDAYNIRVWKSIIHACHSKPLLWVLFLNMMTHNTGGMPPLLCVHVLMWVSVCLFILREVKFVKHLLGCPESLWLWLLLREQTRLSTQVPSHSSDKQRTGSVYVTSQSGKQSLFFSFVYFAAWIPMSVCVSMLVPVYQNIQCAIFVHPMFHTITLGFSVPPVTVPPLSFKSTDGTD